MTLAIYACTARFPEAERFGLARQMRRAAASVGTNIAEGCGRDTQGDFKRFLSMALGSASELEYQLLLAYDLRMLGASEYARLRDDVVSCKRMLATLIAKIAAAQRATQ